MKGYILALIMIMSVCISCRPTPPIPKPKGYAKINLPSSHAYRQFDSAGFPFQFRYPVYGIISQDEKLNKQEKAPYWVNLDIPDLNATIYISYFKLASPQHLDQLIAESYKLSYAHDIRADYIKTPDIITQHGNVGVYYNVGGNAASTYQFFLTDTSKHFIRGALYFNVSPNEDSLQPATQFLKIDVDTLIHSLQFR